jgi:L-fucose isomerase-like protein
MDKPRVRLVVLQADWSGCGEAQSVIEQVAADTTEMTSRLMQHFEINGPWVIDSPETLQTGLRSLRDSGSDMVLLVYQTWAEDKNLVALLQAVGSRPLVLWCYLPWRRLPRPASYADIVRGSGPVGAFGALGTLHNLNIPFLFTYGAPDDPRLVRSLVVAGRAARVRQMLRSARIGLLPSRNEQMQSTLVDEFRLMADLGPVVQYISVSDYWHAVESLPEERVAGYLALLGERCKVKGVSDETLQAAACAALGLAGLAVDYRLDVLALNDASPELQRMFKMRPSLYPDLLEPQEALFQPEGDLGAATASLVLHWLTGSPTMLLEMWFWDEAKNQIVGGHNGMQNPRLAAGPSWVISPDLYFCRPHESEGAQIQFMARPGRVTLFQLRSTPKGWQAIAASGVCLEGQPWADACPHAVVRLDGQIDQFLKLVASVGATQHWILAYGSVLDELEAFCQIASIPLESITY